MPDNEAVHPRITPLLAGVAGEYFVAAELSRRGHIASISLRNTRGIDILATNASASRTVTIQCKTTQLSRRSWVLNEKCESFVSEHHFSAFVALGSPLERPRFHIVPSAAVAEFVRNDHQTWLAKPGKHGQAHVDNPVRQFHDHKDEYLEAWELLGLEVPPISSPSLTNSVVANAAGRQRWFRLPLLSSSAPSLS